MTPGFAKPRAELPWLPYGECNRVIINAHNFGGTWTPANIATAQWFDAADSTTLFDAVSGGSLPANGGNVRRWTDKSGNSRNATIGESGPPTRQTASLNSRDVVRFNGRGLLHTYSNSGANVSVFVIGRRTGGTGFNYFYQASQASQPVSSWVFARSDVNTNWGGFVGGAYRSSGVNVLNRYTLVASTCTSTGSLNLFTDGSSSGSFSGALYGGDTGDRRAIGSYGALADVDVLIGDIAEIVVLDSIASTGTRETIEGYLAHKWGLTANLPSGHPYKSVAP